MMKNEWTEKVEKLEKQVEDLENEIEKLESEARIDELEKKELYKRINDIINQAHDFYFDIKYKGEKVNG